MKVCTAGSAVTRSELGAQRCWHSGYIDIHLKRKGMSRRTIAWQLGISESAVSQTLSGKNHSARVLDALRAAGVPEKYLFDPRRAEAPRKEAA